MEGTSDPAPSLTISEQQQQQQAQDHDSSAAAPLLVPLPPKIQRTTTEESLVPHIGDVDSTNLPGDGEASLKEETEEMSANGALKAEGKSAETVNVVDGIPNPDDEANPEPLNPVYTTSEAANSPAADKAETATQEDAPKSDGKGVDFPAETLEESPSVEPGEANVAKREQVEVDSADPPHGQPVVDSIETVASDLTSDDSNLLLEEKFKSLSLQAKQIGKTPDRSVRKSKPLPRVATMVTKKKTERNEESVPKHVATPRTATSLPRVALLPAKKHDLRTEDEKPSSKPTTSRKRTALPRVATMPHKPATSKAPVNEKEEVPHTRSVKKLTGLPRVATMQKRVRKEASAGSSSQEAKGPPSKEPVGVPRVARLPAPRGTAAKYAGKESRKPVRKNEIPVSVYSHHYLRHTVASAARVNPLVASPPKPGDLVTELLTGGGSSSTSTRKKTTPAPFVTESRGTVSAAAAAAAAAEAQKESTAGLRGSVDEHDRELEKLLSMDEDVEDLDRMVASDHFASPERPQEDYAASEKEEVSPDDVRTLELSASKDGTPVHPKNLDDRATLESVDTPNETVLNQGN